MNPELLPRKNKQRFVGFFEPIEDPKDPRGRPGTPNRPREITGMVSRKCAASGLWYVLPTTL
jgi:hypothetical protein